MTLLVALKTITEIMPFAMKLHKNKLYFMDMLLEKLGDKIRMKLYSKSTDSES